MVHSAIIIRMSQEIEVRFPYTALGTPLRPDIPLLRDNQYFLEWAENTGYNSVEFHALRGVTRDILRKPPDEVAKMTGIKSGHVLFNPFTNSVLETILAVFTRRQDPLRPKEKFNPLVLAFAEWPKAAAALRKLEASKFPDDFHIVTYPYKKSGNNPFGDYHHPLIQIHPEAFNDTRDAEDFIADIASGKYEGMVWDTYQALGATDSGLRPLQPWEKSLPKLLEAGVIKEVHVQAGRTVYIDHAVPSLTWLRSMVAPNHNSELGKMIKMVKAADSAIPFVTEITLDGLVAAGLIKKSDILDPSLTKVMQVYRSLLDYIRRV